MSKKIERERERAPMLSLSHMEPARTHTLLFQGHFASKQEDKDSEPVEKLIVGHKELKRD